ncbi:MAG TPA: DUF4382 domain-containing protein [Woeseiaceae bacterium]|nr:DUF4382 domain-containing protein [Woeseiaceae bacterium]
MKTTRTRLVSVALAASLFITACGGGSSTSEIPAVDNDPQPTTGTILLLLTDKPTDELSEINVAIEGAILIGGDNVDGQQVLYELEPGEMPQTHNILDLQHFNAPIALAQVQPGIYTKLRLLISDIELVDLEGNVLPNVALPANGKIDLLDPNGIEILPGRTLIIEVDIEADKSFMAVGAGNSGRYNFRPVVKAEFMDGDSGEFPGDLDLARVEGMATDIDYAAGTFALCSVEAPDNCVNVATNMDTSIFGTDGTVAAFDMDALPDMSPATVIGTYSLDGGILLNAVLLQIGPDVVSKSGEVVSEPNAGQFLMLTNPETEEEIAVQLQDGTLFFDELGQLGPEAVVLGADLSVEGVVSADVLNAALVFVTPPDEDQISGTISVIEEGAVDTFTVTTDSGDFVVTLVDGHYILLVDVTGSTVTMGTFPTDLYVGQVVDIFGTDTSTETENLFEATEVIVDVNASPPPPAP